MNKYLRIVITSLFVVFIFLWCIKGFCLSWVEIEDGYAKVTVNFLVPMEREDITEKIKVESELTASSFDYTYEWLSDHIVCLKIKETGQITGQKIKLHIQDAMSQYTFIHKHAHIPIQFQTPIKLLSPTQEVLIASHEGFEVQFNTPIALKKLARYVMSEIPFNITPVKTTTADGKTIVDATRFLLTPHEALHNAQTYTIAFREGMPAINGSFLSETQYITLKTDVKPEIISTYPKDGDKWVGLYPRITIVTDKPIVSATMQLGDQIFEGKLIDDKHVQFALKGLLKPETTYTAQFEAVAASGEKSTTKRMNFTTTTIENNRVWVDLKIGTPSVLKVYQGTQLIREMNCSVGKGIYEPTIGTYYLQGKSEVYEDNTHNEGANYWLPIHEKCGFQGVVREDTWQIKNCAANEIGARTDRNNIILEEPDAKWLYENLGIETMIIIRK